MGNQAFIRVTKFKGLLALLLKQGQPRIFLISSTVRTQTHKPSKPVLNNMNDQEDYGVN